MATSKETRRCSRCGHPKNKHTFFTNPGCTVKIFGPAGNGAGFCTCRGFRERVK